jgi:hypothetical protein
VEATLQSTLTVESKQENKVTLTRPVLEPTKIPFAGGGFTEAQKLAYPEGVGIDQVMDKAIKHWTDDLKIFDMNAVAGKQVFFDTTDGNNAKYSGVVLL